MDFKGTTIVKKVKCHIGLSEALLYNFVNSSDLILRIAARHNIIPQMAPYFLVMLKKFKFVALE